MDEAAPILPKTAPPAQARAMDRAVVVLAGAWRDRGLVPTDGQLFDAQHARLIAAGAERVYAQKVSGAVTDRKALARAQAALALARSCWSHASIGSRVQREICSKCAIAAWHRNSVQASQRRWWHQWSAGEARGR
jgi:hypothetical protein